MFIVKRRNMFQDSNFPKSYLLPIKGYSWHKNKMKMIRRGHYCSNNFQDPTKRKSTEKKILGYLPRVLFFNAFELGAVILKDARVSATKELEAKESIKNQRDFYFRALGSLIVLSFPQPLSFSSVLPKPLSETLTRSSDGRNPI
jgi:hypothetical protein